MWAVRLAWLCVALSVRGAVVAPSPAPSPPCDVRNTCGPRPAPSQAAATPFKFRNCFCDNDCARYGDCCANFARPRTADRIRKLESGTVSCRRVYEINPSFELYIVERCPRGYPRDGPLREQCERPATGYADGFFALPVSDADTDVLYRNYFCAACSGVSRPLFWDTHVRCRDASALNVTRHVETDLETATRDSSGNCRVSLRHPLGKAPRKCKSHLRRCDRNWAGGRDAKRRCRTGATDYVYVELEAFKNRHCATCNYVNESVTSCHDIRTPYRPVVISVAPTPPGMMGGRTPFTILFNFNAKTMTATGGGSGGGEEVEMVARCASGHVYDPYQAVCRPVYCAPGVAPGNCVPRPPADVTPAAGNSTTTATATATTTTTAEDAAEPQPDESSSTTTGTTTTTTMTTKPPSRPPPMDFGRSGPRTTPDPPLSPPPSPPSPSPDAMLECPQLMLNESEYVSFANGSLLYVAVSRLLVAREYRRSGRHVFVCSPYHGREYVVLHNVTGTMFEFDRLQAFVSIVGSLVSLFALAVFFVVFAMIAPLRNVPGQCVFSLAASTFVAQLLFLVGTERVEVFAVCVACGAGMHYAFLAAFFWMNVLAIDLCRTFASRGVPSPGGRQRFALYSLYAWLSPAFIVGGSLALDFLRLSDQYRPGYGESLCWITRGRALMVLFALPLALLLVINVVLYCITVVGICLSVKDAAAARGDDSRPQSYLLLYVKLSVLMGGTWIFGFLATLTDWHVLWYAFIVFNTLQGAFICIAFVCTRSVFRMLHGFGRVSSADQDPSGRPGKHRLTKGARTSHTRPTYMYDGEQALVISQETSI